MWGDLQHWGWTDQKNRDHDHVHATSRSIEAPRTYSNICILYPSSSLVPLIFLRFYINPTFINSVGIKDIMSKICFTNHYVPSYIKMKYMLNNNIVFVREKKKKKQEKWSQQTIYDVLGATLFGEKLNQ